jgi:hypothetical protein
VGVRIPAVTDFRSLPTSNSVDAGSPFLSIVVELATYLHLVSNLRKAGSVGIVTGLSARRSEVRIPAGITELFFLELSRLAPAYFLWRTVDFLWRPRHEDDHSHSYRAEVNIGLGYTPTSSCRASWPARIQFYLYLCLFLD